MSVVPPPVKKRLDRQDSVETVMRATYSYTAQNNDELSIAVDDVVYVLSASTDAGWVKCRSGNNIGLVPANYLSENLATIENPLHEAAKRGNIEFVKELIDNKVSANSLDKARNTPLHWACRGGHHQVVDLLLKQKPTINAQNRIGDTALHLAAVSGSVETVSLLLESDGIDTLLRNKDGATARDLAKNDQVASLLIQFSSTVTNGEDQDEDD